MNPRRASFPLACFVLACFAPACSPSSEPSTLAPPPASTSTLPAGIVSRSGALSISAQTVASVATALQITPRDALEREIRDAVFANGALARGLDQSPLVGAALRGTLARAVLETIKQEASETEPSDAEIAEVTARHFVELDRPEAFRVIHTVVKVPDKADNAVKLRARAVATRLAERVAMTTDEAEFRRLAESIGDRDGLEVVVETLKPVAADGRVIDVDRPSDQQTFVLPFARAASRLTQPGQKSGVVATEFGFHAMMLLERIPAHVVPLDERRLLLRDEILTDRAWRLKKELLKRLQSNVATTVERSAEGLLATVDVAGHETP